MRLSYIQSGLCLLLLAAVQLALFHIFVDTIFDEKAFFGAIAWGGMLTPTPGNVRLLLLLRAIAVVSGIPVLAGVLYPQTWQDLKHSIGGRNRKILGAGILSGLSLFAAEFLLSIACWQIPPGLALSFFLMYPILTVLGAWKLWGYRPSQGRVTAMTIVAIGSLLAIPLPPFFVATTSQVMVGIVTAVAGGIAFASYLLLTYRGTRMLHPLPFSAIAFSIVFVLSCFSFLLPIPGLEIQVAPSELPPLIVAGIIIGILTLVGYLLTHYGILLAGATRAAIATASAPALSVLFGPILIQGSADIKQVFAILLVILGLLILTVEPMNRRDWYD